VNIVAADDWLQYEHVLESREVVSWGHMPKIIAQPSSPARLLARSAVICLGTHKVTGNQTEVFPTSAARIRGSASKDPHYKGGPQDGLGLLEEVSLKGQPVTCC
jgi:hypothetical protein